MIKHLFLISVALSFYVYIGFPLLLWVLRAFVRRAPPGRPCEPSVSLLVAAYNEAAVIASAQLVNGNTVLTLPDQTSVILVGVRHIDTGIFVS